MARAPKKKQDEAAEEPTVVDLLRIPAAAKFKAADFNSGTVVDPASQLNVELARTSYIIHLLDQVFEANPDALFNPTHEPLQDRHLAERKHLASITTAVLKLGIEGALVAVESKKVDLLIEALNLALQQEGLDDAIVRRVRATLASHLLALETAT